MTYLDHTYSGPGRPIGPGGAVDWSVEPEQISGAFHVDDFQDGAGLRLSNGERPEKHWLVTGRGRYRRVRRVV